MSSQNAQFEDYFQHLNTISLKGRLFKKLYSSPILFLLARRFGPRLIEVGAGIGSGVLGTFPSRVVGLDINPQAVAYCRSRNLDAQLINGDGTFPIADGSFDACILDNVLEHIEDPRTTLDECWRITSPGGGMVIAVPGIRGFHLDPDHKVFYDEEGLRNLDRRWTMVGSFAGPLFLRSNRLSKSMRLYGLVATYKKN